MARQHCVPLLIPEGGGAVALAPLGTATGADAISEADIQALVHAHPGCLPIAEIDPAFVDPVAICRELWTPVGAIDNFMVTPSGMPILVECKLWRNPEGRREIIGQILDYAKELSRWSSSDLQREVKKRLRGDGNPLVDLVRKAAPDLDEVAFNDALTRNLRKGRFLLILAGDGIREGVEAIAEYVQRHAGLHFTFGLVELPFFVLPDGSRLVAPRILARTVLVNREVVTVPEGQMVREPDDQSAATDVDPARAAMGDEQQRFWKEFLSGVRLDDPDQPIAKPARLGNIAFYLPAPSGSSWLTVYRDQRRNEVGIFLSSHRNTVGEQAMVAVAGDWEEVREELGGTAQLTQKDGRPRIMDVLSPGALQQPEVREHAFEWLRERLNTFVNVLRPRVRAAVADIEQPVA